MKLLTTVQTREELLPLQSLLREKGIPSFLQNEFTSNNLLGAGLMCGLFIHQEQQLADAKMLLLNSAHQPKISYTEEQMQAIEAGFVKKKSTYMGKIAEISGVLLVTSIALIAYLVYFT